MLHGLILCCSSGFASLTDGRSLLQGYTIRHGYQRASYSVPVSLIRIGNSRVKTLQSVRGRRGRRERDERQEHQQTVRTELDPADYRLCRRLQRADKFLEAAKLAAERGKPIVLIKIDSNASGCSSLESGVNRLAVQDDVRLR